METLLGLMLLGLPLLLIIFLLGFGVYAVIQAARTGDRIHLALFPEKIQQREARRAAREARRATRAERRE